MLAALLLVVMYTDFRWLRIPNAVTYPAMLIGLVFGVVEGIPGGLFTGGLIDHLAALVLAFALSYPFYAAGGLKAGDAKLLMAIGAMRGTSFFLVSALYGALLGGLMRSRSRASSRSEHRDGHPYRWRRTRPAPVNSAGTQLRGAILTRG
ncbi:MAG: hypothetical protein AUI15_12965 [Actinobacteria bacterium 13_2_20CM_2_66_6]|nr:MAG: hypothetical protein AUI15_12965 [Actinobacteria bacterium 13_2_20CM_2_66_6]